MSNSGKMEVYAKLFSSTEDQQTGEEFQAHEVRELLDNGEWNVAPGGYYYTRNSERIRLECAFCLCSHRPSQNNPEINNNVLKAIPKSSHFSHSDGVETCKEEGCPCYRLISIKNPYRDYRIRTTRILKIIIDDDEWKVKPEVRVQPPMDFVTQFPSEDRRRDILEELGWHDDEIAYGHNSNLPTEEDFIVPVNKPYNSHDKIDKKEKLRIRYEGWGNPQLFIKKEEGKIISNFTSKRDNPGLWFSTSLDQDQELEFMPMEYEISESDKSITIQSPTSGRVRLLVVSNEENCNVDGIHGEHHHHSAEEIGEGVLVKLCLNFAPGLSSNHSLVGHMVRLDFSPDGIITDCIDQKLWEKFSEILICRLWEGSDVSGVKIRWKIPDFDMFKLYSGKEGTLLLSKRGSEKELPLRASISALDRHDDFSSRQMKRVMTEQELSGESQITDLGLSRRTKQNSCNIRSSRKGKGRFIGLNIQGKGIVDISFKDSSLLSFTNYENSNIDNLIIEEIEEDTDAFQTLRRAAFSSVCSFEGLDVIKNESDEVMLFDSIRAIIHQHKDNEFTSRLITQQLDKILPFVNYESSVLESLMEVEQIQIPPNSASFQKSSRLKWKVMPSGVFFTDSCDKSLLFDIRPSLLFVKEEEIALDQIIHLKSGHRLIPKQVALELIKKPNFQRFERFPGLTYCEESPEEMILSLEKQKSITQKFIEANNRDNFHELMLIIDPFELDEINPLIAPWNLDEEETRILNGPWDRHKATIILIDGKEYSIHRIISPIEEEDYRWAMSDFREQKDHLFFLRIKDTESDNMVLLYSTLDNNLACVPMEWKEWVKSAPKKYWGERRRQPLREIIRAFISISLRETDANKWERYSEAPDWAKYLAPRVIYHLFNSQPSSLFSELCTYDSDLANYLDTEISTMLWFDFPSNN